MESTIKDSRVSALTIECEAIDRYRDLEEWFAERDLAELAALCARLAAWHRDAYASHAESEERIPIETIRAAAVPWISRQAPDASPREFLYRLASAKDLLEMALADEASEHCAAQLRSAIGKLGPVHWESDIESGAGPSLALGAERRLHRTDPPRG